MKQNKLKQFSTREFVRVLMDNGYEFLRQKGSHLTYVKGNQTITINNCKSDFNQMMARRLIKTYNLKV